MPGGSLEARSLPRSLEESSTKENLVGGQERSTGDTYMQQRGVEDGHISRWKCFRPTIPGFLA